MKKPKNNALVRAGLVDKAIKNVKEESPATSIGNNSVALPPTVKQIVVTDRRYRKDKAPKIRKFGKWMKESFNND
jgi:hypothetical protein